MICKCIKTQIRIVATQVRIGYAKMDHDDYRLHKDIPVEWVRVQIKETTEVNGVRFPSGIQIDVTDEDAKQMIEGDKAILLEEVEKKEDEKKEDE